MDVEDVAAPEHQQAQRENKADDGGWPYMAQYNIDPASLRENRSPSQSSKDVCVGFVLELN